MSKSNVLANNGADMRLFANNSKKLFHISTMFKRFSKIAAVALLLVAGKNTFAQNYSWNGNSSTAQTFNCGTTYTIQDAETNNDRAKSVTFTCNSACSIRVTLTANGLKKKGSNTYDYLYVYDGTSDTGTSLAAWRNGSGTNVSVNSTSNSVTLKFVDNATGNGNHSTFTVTLYADCPSQHTLTYNMTANCTGGTISIPNIPSVTGTSAIVTNAQPSCSTATFFNGWNTAADGSGTSYNSQDEIDLSCQNVTLYAQYNNVNFCVSALPFCTDQGDSYSYTASTTSSQATDINGGTSVGCLSRTPSPTWFYMRMDQDGDMLIHMAHSDGRDIDFACWGPFDAESMDELLNENCTANLSVSTTASTHRPTDGVHYSGGQWQLGGYPVGNMVDCSYNSAATEWCYIHDAHEGEWYIFLITNYSKAAGTITFESEPLSNAGAPSGTQQANTDCEIIPSCIIGLTATASDCDPATNTYSVTGSFILTDAPESGTITITMGSSTQTITYSPTNTIDNPYFYTISDLTSDGQLHTVSVRLESELVTCNASRSFTAPASCEPCPDVTASVEDYDEFTGGYYYFDVCLGETVTLTAEQQGYTNPTYEWLINAHNGPITHQNGASITYTPAEVTGYDISLVITEGDCSTVVKVRIRVSDGLESSVSSYDLGTVCVGNTGTITVGTVAGCNIGISEEEHQITPVMGQSQTTFIPDGPECDEQCYTSSIEFTEFVDGATLTSADQINYLLINIEHTFMGDMQIKLTCPNGRSAIILQDFYTTEAQGAIDTYTYDYPHVVTQCYSLYRNSTYCIAMNRTNFYQNTISTNSVTIGGARYYPVRFSTAEEAQSFLEVNRFSSDYSVAGPSNGYYGIVNAAGNYLYVNWTTSTNSSNLLYFSSTEYAQNFTQLNFQRQYSTYSYTYQCNTSYSRIFMGEPNTADIANPASNPCNQSATVNSAGTGASYIWSNSTTNGYTYADGNGYIYDSENIQPYGESYYQVIPSDQGDMSQIYHPYQNFSSLVGCPLNGQWTVSVCDSWAEDNGYVFNWEFSVDGSLLAEAWSYDIELDEVTTTCSDAEVVGTNVVVTPTSGSSGTKNCVVTIVDNLGCEVQVPITYVVTEPTITLTSGTATQSVCNGTAISNIVYTIGGTATGATATGLPTGVTASVSGTTVTISGTPSVTGTFNYTITTTGPTTPCINNSLTGTITVTDPNITPTFTQLGPYCVGATPGTLPTTSTNSITGTWSPATISTTAAGSTTYTFTPTSGQCALPTTMTVVVNANPTVTVATPDALTCANTSSTITATSNAASYSWTGGTTTAALTVTTPGTYTVTVTGANGCTATASKTVSQDITNPTLSINDPETLTCALTSQTLTATSNATTYSWSTGSTAEAILVTTPGTYTVTVTGTNGCTATASKTVSQDIATPTLTLSNPATLTCATTSTTITATSNAASYSWTGGTTTAALIVTTPGTYTVTVTGANGCTATASKGVSQDITNPTLSLNDLETLTCNLTTQNLTATTNANTYAWESGETTATIEVTAHGTYTVTVTGTNGCTATASKTVSQDIATPTLTLSDPETLTCATTSTTITATSNAASYSWTGGTTTAALTVTTPGTYTVTVTGANGCTATASKTVSQDITNPTLSINDPETLTCALTSQTLTATSNATTYSWSTGSTAEAILVTTPETYTVTVTGANGCTTSASKVVSQDIATPTLTLSDPETLTCATSSTTITATSNAASYSWTGGTTTAALTVTTPGTYTVTVTGANGCTATASKTVSQDITNPTLSLNDMEVLTCALTSQTLTATTDANIYAWESGETTASLTITNPGTYTVTVTGANGCTTSASKTVSQDITTPTLSLNTPETLTCDITEQTLTATTNAISYAWESGETTASITVTTPDTYAVTVTGTNGCTTSASVTVNQNITVPTVDITNTTGTTEITCDVTSISLTATGTGVSYEWSTGATTADLTVTTPNTYTVTSTGANGCTSETSITITESVGRPTLSINTPEILTCALTTQTLTATTDVTTYLWSTGASTQSIDVTAPNTYSVTVTGANGCTTSASVVVSQDIVNPTLSINTPETLTCALTSQTLTATTDANIYAWESGETTSSLTITNPGTYTVTVTGANGCTTSASKTVSQDITNPTLTLNDMEVLTCALTSQTLTATTDANIYAWESGETTSSLTITNPGTYTVTVTGANGCTTSASKTVSQDITNPTLSLNDMEVLTCALTSQTLTATTDANIYAWESGETTSSLTITNPGTYIVTVTGANGCTTSASKTVSQDITNPTLSLNDMEVLTCALTSQTLTATTDANIYAWESGETTSSLTITNPGTYTVTVTGANGCTTSASKVVSQDIVSPTLDITNNTGETELTCDVTSISLTATGTGVSYEWSTGATTADLTVTTPNTYTVTSTGANGCTSQTSITITESVGRPTLSINTPEILTCALTTQTLTATTDVTTYLWSTGASTQSIDVTAPNTYSVTVTGVNGCTTSASVVVSQDIVNPTLSINTPETLTCAVTSQTLTATTNANIYAWSTGVTTQSITVTAPNTYTVTVTGANGCTTSASMVVNQDIVNPTLLINTPETLTCAVTSQTLTATTDANIYAWSTGASTQSITVVAPNTYTVTVTGANGCTTSASMVVNQDVVNPTLSINTPETLTCAVTSQTLTATTDANIYAWESGETTSSLTITNPGTYTVTVTGANGCTTSASMVVNQDIVNPILSINTPETLTCAVTNQTLTATTDASIYEWSTGATTRSIDVTAPNTYSVTVTGANGCTTSVSMVVNQNIVNPTLSINTPEILTCATTSQTLTATTDVNIYAWSTGATTQSIDVTLPNTYSVTVTGTNGCTTSASMVVNQDIVNPTLSINTPEVLTCDVTSQTLTATTDASIYEWSNGALTQSIIVTAPETYIVTVTGANGCTTSASMVVNQNVNNPTLSINTPETLTCAVVSQTLTATTNAGTYLWSTGATTQSIEVTAPETYFVTVTGDNGCRTTASMIVNQDIANPSLSIPQPEILTCATTSETLTAMTDVSTYLWSTGATTQSIDVTFPNTYSVVVTGANGCTTSASVVVSQDIVPPTLSINTPQVLTCDVTSQTLTATTDASVYEWSTSARSQDINVIAPNTYTVTVTGANGCTTSASMDVSQDIVNPTLTINTPEVLTCATTSQTLTAITDATAYSWSTGASTQSIDVTNPETYSVVVTGLNGCTTSASVTVSQDVVNPTLTINTPEVLTCALTTQTLTATTNANIYAWSVGSSTQSINVTTPDTYSVTVTGANGCTTSASVVVDQNVVNPTLSINTPEVLTCNLTTQTLTATTDAGTYLWSTGANTQNIDVTVPNTYSVVVTGANGCTTSASVLVSQDISTPVVNTINNIGTDILTCNTTSISVTAQGSGVSYAWSNGAPVATTSFTTPGTYTVVSTGANGCTSSAQVVITQDLSQPTVIVANNTGTYELTCSVTSIDVTADGSGISYVWSNGSTIPANTFTQPGTYTVTATGYNGCTSSTQVVITQDQSLPTVTINNNSGTTVLTCTTTGISLTAQGSGVSYVWSNAISNANVTIVTPGTYTVTSTGNNGCTNATQITITEDLELPVVTITNNTGASELNCSVTSITMTAGTGVAYVWSNGSNANTTTLTAPGTYTVTVTGENGCTNTSSVSITEASPLIANISNVGSILCYGGNTTASVVANGGTPEYSYIWSNGQTTATATNLTSGSYSVTVNDMGGCYQVLNVVLTQPEEVRLTIAPSNIHCGNSLGVINTTVAGGTQPYSYVWSNGSNEANATNLFAGEYSVTVSDANGCQTSQSAAIEIDGNIQVDVNIAQRISCSGYSDGILEAVTNGAAPLTYLWSDGQASQFAGNLAAGTYSVEIIDNWGCSGSATNTLIAPQPISMTYTVNDARCYDTPNGSIRLHITGGTMPYAFTWSNSVAQGQYPSNLPAGTYTVTVSDISNCTSTATMTIGSPEDIVLNVVARDITCFGKENGAITIAAVGGTAPYVYSITTSDDIIHGSSVTKLPAGSYEVVVSDFHGCEKHEIALITEPTALTATAIVSNPSCFNARDGQVEFTVAGGTEPYTYIYNTFYSDVPLIPGLTQGAYSLSVRDANNCTIDVDAVALRDDEVDCIWIPNVFTPNGDGVNDEWIIRNINKFPEADIYVFNRWGQQLYYSKGDGEPWDGRFKDHFVPAGCYLYIVDLHNSQETYEGVVTVVY